VTPTLSSAAERTFQARLRAKLEFDEFVNRVYDISYSRQFAEAVTMYHPTQNTLDALGSKAQRIVCGMCQLQHYHPNHYGTPSISPRPTVIKRPSRTLPIQDRIAFSALSTTLTTVQGVGYYNKYLTKAIHVDDGIPQPDD